MNAKETYVAKASDKFVHILKAEVTGMLQGCRHNPEVKSSQFPFGQENIFSFTTPNAALATATLKIDWLKDVSNQPESG